MGLNNYPTKTLEIELERRKKELNAPPAPLEKPDFNKLKELVVRLVKDEANGEDDDNRDHWIYEAAMDAVYGETYWKWHRERNR